MSWISIEMAFHKRVVIYLAAFVHFGTGRLVNWSAKRLKALEARS